jgi:hypothetical protein
VEMGKDMVRIIGEEDKIIGEMGKAGIIEEIIIIIIQILSQLATIGGQIVHFMEIIKDKIGMEIEPELGEEEIGEAAIANIK